MFRKHFKVLYYEKIYFYSCLITFISLFLPWFRALHVFVPGIILPLGASYSNCIVNQYNHLLSREKKKESVIDF